jgi:hypothetical protein
VSELFDNVHPRIKTDVEGLTSLLFSDICFSIRVGGKMGPSRMKSQFLNIDISIIFTRLSGEGGIGK